MRKALVVLAATAALAVSGAAAYAAGTGASGGMHDRMANTGMPAMDMGSMDMGSMDMGSMDMGSMDMGSMGMDAMHAQMRDGMTAEMAEACDTAHAGMSRPSATAPTG